MFFLTMSPSPHSVPKKLMTTVVTTNSTAIVEMMAPYCRNIGNRRVEEVVDALQRIEERQPPESDQRQPVAPDRLLQDDRHEVVHHAPAHRRDEQADQVVDEQSADRSGIGAGQRVLGQEVAHGVGQKRPDKRRHEVPQRDVHGTFATWRSAPGS